MEILPAILTLIAFCVVLWFYILLPYGMAQKRGRSAILWVLLGFLASPFVTIILLLALGPVAGFQMAEAKE